ncbi:Crp/Fnr family transcriptional regulator [Sphingomonas sp. PL-96]|uniref:Crp/Fnr family transcriptional regulator n=1 Tax=Sphingomonas sp. PL-96 TaxID=2887201 RepID=UPI001E464080|nr:Crp/Fnr family transcriptional regulator [Sphingomonas sp. PL-96]MCC2977040.1 Crp/Fnr family transcriptional regulator [Sphingomonas sp. PL-96]
MPFVAAAESLRLFLGKLAAHTDLTAEQERAVLALPAAPKRIAANREIIRLGERVDYACLVAEGVVSRFAQLEDGRRQLITFHIAGDMANLFSLALPAAPGALLAASATTIFQIPHGALRDLTADYPILAAALWRDCIIDGNIVAQRLVNIGRRTARGRVAHLLCELALRYRAIGEVRDGRFPLAITQELMADALGLTAVHVNRSLKVLRDEGLAQISRSEVQIHDWDGLVEAAEFDPDYLCLPRPDGDARASRGLA